MQLPPAGMLGSVVTVSCLSPVLALQVQVTICFLISYVGFSFFVREVHESDAAGHGTEDGEPRRQSWHEAWHAAWHGRTGRCQKPVWAHLSVFQYDSNFTLNIKVFTYKAQRLTFCVGMMYFKCVAAL